MGLFSFIKNAGAKIFGKKAEAPAQPKFDPEKGQQLENFVNKMGLEVDGLKIQVQDDMAIVHGTTESQSIREKVVLAVGNTAGIAQVDDRIDVKVPEPEAKFHTVQSGDTLSKIAKNYYGDAMKYPVIFEANKPMLEHPDKIYPGQVLRIPNMA